MFVLREASRGLLPGQTSDCAYRVQVLFAADIH